jgi:phage tail sheath protein FI
MAQYASPGVYVEEVPSATKPIAGVSTSTAGFIGILPLSYRIPTGVSRSKVFAGDGKTTSFPLANDPVADQKVSVEGRTVSSSKITSAPPWNNLEILVTALPSDIVTVDYTGVARTTAFAKVEDIADKKLKLILQNGETINGVPAVTKGDTTTTVNSTFDAKTNVVTLTENVTGAVTVTYKVDGKDVPLGTYKDLPISLADAITASNQPAVKINYGPLAADQYTTTGKKINIKTTEIPPPPGATILVDYSIGPQTQQAVVVKDQTQSIALQYYPVLKESVTAAIGNDAVAADALQVQNNLTLGTASLTIYKPAQGGPTTITYKVLPTFNPAAGAGEPVRCNSFSDYKKAFGDFSSDENQRNLTHAVYGFFNNGGTTCYVTYLTVANLVNDIAKALDAFERISDISIVVAPGIGADNDDIRNSIAAHCAKMGDRFAIFDGPSPKTAGADDIDKLTKIKANQGFMPQSTTYAAWYYPWIKVVDPVTKMLGPDTDGTIYVPPSGHIAGVYARVDNTRGVHKAPANEPIYGALDVAHKLSNTEQGILNPKGVNCIRVLNNSILVWGARTVGGDANADLKYVNVRRTLLYLRKSVYEGTQWVVFEPNTPALWQKITRNVDAFLTNVWRSGALFGTTAQEAFYVKCDAETNPPELRDLGQVVTEIGVAIVRPAEFVIFRISQWSGPGQ